MAGAPPAIEQAAVQAAAQLGAQPGALPADLAAKVAEAPRLVREAPSRPQPIGISLLRQAGLAFVPDTAPRSRLSEELTLVQQQLLRAMAAPAQPGRPHVGRNAVLVTSARTGEGKSFVALNLAASIASSTSHQVVLVDVDGFGSSLTQGLSLAEAPVSGPWPLTLRSPRSRSSGRPRSTG
jgi:receptor protein-tyrosine kinase